MASTTEASSPILLVLNQPSAEAAPHTEGDAPFRQVGVDEPVLRVVDLGATRGDGIFEAASVVRGRPQALEHHLSRFAKSARALDLPAPDLDVWRDALITASEQLAHLDAAWVKAVMTRGDEGDGRPNGWVLAIAAPDFTRDRVDGVSVVLLDRGLRHDVEATSPWLLAGAKTLSYAVNRASVREAKRRGADDVVFVSSDGYLLEGPSASLIYRVGDTLVTPGTGLGILDGTTQVNVFRFAEARGLATEYRLATPDELVGADAAWLVSSVRHAAPIWAVDGVAKAIDTEFTAELNDYLDTVDG